MTYDLQTDCKIDMRNSHYFESKVSKGNVRKHDYKEFRRKRTVTKLLSIWDSTDLVAIEAAEIVRHYIIIATI